MEKINMNSKKYVKSFEIKKRIGHPIIFRIITFFCQLFFKNFKNLKKKLKKLT